MTKPYIAISALIFAIVALVHIVRVARGWDVQIAGIGIAMSASWGALIVSAALALWAVMLLRR